MLAEEFVGVLREHGINFYTGVPDSFLKEVLNYINFKFESENLIAANEGNAVALAAGHYLSTGKPALCYMQNSGIGNAINPILSLLDPMVYGIPVMFLIGYRGKSGIKDEPQHKKQGLVTEELLSTVGIEYKVISSEFTKNELSEILSCKLPEMKATGKSFAFVAEKNTFDEYVFTPEKSPYKLERERAIEIVVENLKDFWFVSTTGHISRELFEIRERKKEIHDRDFLTVGSMGHSSMIAFGIAKNHLNKKIAVLDGDGALIMHMGAMSTIGASDLSDFFHIVFNNGAHDSVGGLPTKGFDISFKETAKALGYDYAESVSDEVSLREFLSEGINGKIFLEIRVKKGARKNLGRPTLSTFEMKEKFMKSLEG